MPNNEKPTTFTAITPPEKPAISIRRLSGDKLSLSTPRIEPNLQPTAFDNPPNMTIMEMPTTQQPPPIQLGSTLKITNVFSLGGQPRPPNPTINQVAIPKPQTSLVSRPNVLKPWSKLPCLKSEEVCTTMLQNLTLYSLFKCMATECHFSNSSAETMVQHLRYHMMRTFIPPSTKASWLECAYCDEPFDRFEVLVNHIIAEHSTSIFQCPYCFYRACAAHNVLLHIRDMHQTSEPLVFVCRGKAKMLTSDLPSIFASRNQNVKPIVCSKGILTFIFFKQNLQCLKCILFP